MATGRTAEERREAACRKLISRSRAIIQASGRSGSARESIRDLLVASLPYGNGALAAQRDEGRILACRARPCSNLEIVWLGRGRR
jgi:hypothetical protein